jgi:hypothetical protein
MNIKSWWRAIDDEMDYASVRIWQQERLTDCVINPAIKPTEENDGSRSNATTTAQQEN